LEVLVKSDNGGSYPNPLIHGQGKKGGNRTSIIFYIVGKKLVVVPQSLLMAMKGLTTIQTAPADTQVSATRSRSIIMEIERGLGFEPIDREFEKIGYDIESKVPGIGKLRFIEVKGRISGEATLTITKNEILYSFNKPEDFILAIVEFFPNDSHRVHYLRRPFQREPDFGVTSVNYNFADLLVRAGEPS
jgi:hypothetical protein